MINKLRKKIIVFAAVIVCSFPFMSKKVNAAKTEVKPTSIQVSPQNPNLIMMYFSDQINQIILKHMSYLSINPFQSVGVVYTNIGITQGSFRVETPQGASFTISSPKWFQIRIVQTQVRGDSRTFPMPVIEYRVEDVENPPVAVIEYPDTSIEIQPTRVAESPEFQNVLVRYFLANVNHSIREYLRRRPNDELPSVVSQWQSGMYRMVEYPDGGQIVIPFGEGNISISSNRWFRMRVMQSRVEGRPGKVYYSPIIEYKIEDIDNPPRVVFNNVRTDSMRALTEDDGCCCEECPVCLGVLNKDNVTLPCGHKFCKTCIDHWIEEYNTETVEDVLVEITFPVSEVAGDPANAVPGARFLGRRDYSQDDAVYVYEVTESTVTKPRQQPCCPLCHTPIHK